MPHGWLILDKPLGLGSTQGVSAVKRALRDGGYPKAKVGHGGTLDPLASGVLPIAIGEATKLAGRLLDSDKIYDFTVRFGVETDTLDLEGKPVAESDVRPTSVQVDAILPSFTGQIAQVPPVYSALKVDGERALRLSTGGSRGDAREPGRDRPLPRAEEDPHPTLSREGGRGLRRRRAAVEDEGRLLDGITLTAHVSKGTYIRSLARDIAQALGTVGHVTMLRRTKAGPFTLDSAISLDKLAGSATSRDLERLLLPLRAGLDDIPALSLDPDQAGSLRQGRVLTGIAADDGQHFATLGDVPVALVEVLDREARVIRGFNL